MAGALSGYPSIKVAFGLPKVVGFIVPLVTPASTVINGEGVGFVFPVTLLLL
jgi:hypothetical protein